MNAIIIIDISMKRMNIMKQICIHKLNLLHIKHIMLIFNTMNKELPLEDA